MEEVDSVFQNRTNILFPQLLSPANDRVCVERKRLNIATNHLHFLVEWIYRTLLFLRLCDVTSRMRLYSTVSLSATQSPGTNSITCDVTDAHSRIDAFYLVDFYDSFHLLHPYRPRS